MTLRERSTPQFLVVSAKIARDLRVNPRQAVAVAVAVAVVAAVSACGKAAAPVQPPVAVSVAHAERGEAPDIIVANGIVEPLQTVAVQSQVGAVLTPVRFK